MFWNAPVLSLIFGQVEVQKVPEKHFLAEIITEKPGFSLAIWTRATTRVKGSQEQIAFCFHSEVRGSDICIVCSAMP